MSKNKNKDLDINDEIDLEINDLNNSNGEKDELDDLFDELDIKENSDDVDDNDLEEFNFEEFESDLESNSSKTDKEYDDIDLDEKENSPKSKNEEEDFEDFDDFDLDEKENSPKSKNKEEDFEDFDLDEKENSPKSKNEEENNLFDEESLESESNLSKSEEDEIEDDFDLENELGLIDNKENNDLADLDDLFDTKNEEQKEISDVKKSRKSENDFLDVLDNKSDLSFHDDSEKEESQSDLMADILNIDSPSNSNNTNKNLNNNNDDSIEKSYMDSKKEEVKLEKVEDKKVKEEKKESSAKKISSLKPSSNNNYSIKGFLIGFSALVSISAILSGSYLFKDEIVAKIQGQNIVAENIEEQSKLFSSKFVEKEKFNKSVNDFNELTLKYENLSQLSLKLESIAQAQAVKLKELFSELELKDTHLNQLQGLVNTNDAIISEFNKKVDNQKEMLTKAIKLTLGVIDENKEINKKNAEEIYNKVFSELKSELTTEKSKLYDFSIMEERLSSVLSSNKEILNEVIEVKKENVRLRSKVSKLEAQVKDERIDPQANESTVIDMLTNDNQKAKNEKSSAGIEITKKKSKSQESDNLPLYNIIGIVEGIAYILPEGARSKNDLTVYKVNDFIAGYGRILRITDSQIIAEKGVVRKK